MKKHFVSPAFWAASIGFVLGIVATCTYFSVVESVRNILERRSQQQAVARVTKAKREKLVVPVPVPKGAPAYDENLYPVYPPRRVVPTGL